LQCLLAFPLNISCMISPWRETMTSGILFLMSSI
jgi:hypothetical protein